MKKPKSTKGKAATNAECLVPSPAADNQAPPREGGSPDGATPSHDLPAAAKQTENRVGTFDDVPEDALPPQRPDPVLNLKLSAALHLKLRHQAQDEGISIESLIQEMLAESVVLRAWEIVERKNAMRGTGTSMGQNQPHSHGNTNRGNYGGNQQVNGNTKHSRPHYGANSGQGSYGNSGRHGGYQSQQGRPPNNAWMEDKAAFLEYVRNQEKRGRR